MPRILLLLAFFVNINLYSQQNLNLSKIDRSVIVMDGLISEDEIENAVIKTVDYEWRPGDNTPARLQTELFLSYTSEELYVIVKAYGNPDEIRGQVRPRDQMESLNEDIVFLRFDPYLDSRSIYLLASNAYGSQSDIRAKNALNDEGRYDSSFNAVYETASSIKAISSGVRPRHPKVERIGRLFLIPDLSCGIKPGLGLIP